MLKLHNSERDIKLRSYQDTLIIGGIGTMVFGIWSVVKYVGVMLMRRGIILEEFKNSPEYGGIAEAGVSDTLIFNFIFGMVLAVLILELIFRLYIGASAVAEGSGTRKRKNGIYIFLAIIMIIFSISTMTTNILSGFKMHDDEAMALFGEDNTISAFIIEATSTIMLIQMVYSARKVRKYNRLGKHSKVK